MIYQTNLTKKYNTKQSIEFLFMFIDYIEFHWTFSTFRKSLIFIWNLEFSHNIFNFLETTFNYHGKHWTFIKHLRFSLKTLNMHQKSWTIIQNCQLSFKTKSFSATSLKLWERLSAHERAWARMSAKALSGNETRVTTLLFFFEI